MFSRFLAPALAAAALSVLLTPAMVMGQSTTYAEDCLTHVDNATIHIPASDSLALPTGNLVESGDTLAVYTDQGDCAGYGVWQDSSGVTLAAAAEDSIDTSVGGYTDGEPLQFEVFDVSAGSAVEIGTSVSYASCDDSGLAICRDDGSYDNGTIHQVTSFETNSSSSITRTIATTNGWNLLSVPVDVDDPSFGAVLPACSSGFLYSPSTGYTSLGSTDPVPAGEGGFFQCAPDTTSVTGQTVTPTVEVESGWNAIGTFADTVSVGAVTSSPAGIVVSDVFEMTQSGGYQSVTTLHPGQGYWVKISEAGTLDLSGSAPSSAAIANAESEGAPHNAGATRLLVTDADGHQATLWLHEELTDAQRRSFERPPLPPEGVFDVRFTSGYVAAALSEGNGRATRDLQHQIDMQGVAFPVELRLETEREERAVRIAASEQDVTLSTERPAVELEASTDQVTVQPVTTPGTFTLGKTSPNPLRNQASMEYTLPEETDVSIALYDVLGRRVANLVDGARRAGVHRTQIEADALSSGVYFVRMTAGSFQKTRRLTVVR